MFDPNKQKVEPPTWPNHIRVTGVQWTGGTGPLSTCVVFGGSPQPPRDLTLVNYDHFGALYAVDVPDINWHCVIFGDTSGTPGAIWQLALDGTPPHAQSFYDGPPSPYGSSPVGVYTGETACDIPATLTVIAIP